MKLLLSFTVPVAAVAGDNTNKDVSNANANTNGRNLALLFTIYPLFSSASVAVIGHNGFVDKRMKGSARLPAGTGPALGAEAGDAMRTSLCSLFKAYAVVHYAFSHVKAYFGTP